MRDERPFGSTAPPAVFYRYAPDRKAEQSAGLLEGAAGYLHADAYVGFQPLYAVSRINDLLSTAQQLMLRRGGRLPHERITSCPQEMS